MTSTAQDTRHGKGEAVAQKTGFLEKLSLFAEAMDYDPQDALVREVKALRAEVQMLADEIELLKRK